MAAKKPLSSKGSPSNSPRSFEISRKPLNFQLLMNEQNKSPSNKSNSCKSKNEQNITDFFSNKAKFEDLNEAQIKKKLLNSIDIEKEDTIETFKKYVKTLIERKLAQQKEQKNNAVDPETRIKQLLQLKTKKKVSDEINEKENTKQETRENNEAEDRDLVQSTMNHEKILMTSKKLRDRMKTEKIDRAARFYKHKIKHFSNLDTFINAKEFFEELNPYKEVNSSRQTTSYQTKKHLLALKKLQKESNDFYDKRMKEFNERMNELNTAGTNQNKDELTSQNSKKSYESSSESSILSLMNRNDKRNFTRMSITQDKKQKNAGNTGSNPIIKANFSDNINFLEQQLGMNKSVVDFFKEFYNPNGQIKKNRSKVTEIDQMRTSVMRHLLVTDYSLNRLDCQIEINEDFNQLDGFYNKTLGVLNKEKNLFKPKFDAKKEEIELQSLIRLEKILENLLKKNKKNKKNKEIETMKKYEEFQKKSNKLVNIIDKTSRTIFYEKHKELTNKVNKHVQAYKRRSMGNISWKKTGSVSIPGVYLTSLDQELSEENQSIKKYQTKTATHFKSPSISLPIPNNFPDFNQKTMNIPNILPFNSEEKRKHHSIYDLPWRNDLNNFNKNAHNFMPFTKKRAIRTISNIIDKTENIRENYKNERKDLGYLENEYDKFFKETSKRIDPPLESIIMTLEKPNHSFKFNAFKTKPIVVKKHIIS